MRQLCSAPSNCGTRKNASVPTTGPQSPPAPPTTTISRKKIEKSAEKSSVVSTVFCTANRSADDECEQLQAHERNARGGRRVWIVADRDHRTTESRAHEIADQPELNDDRAHDQDINAAQSES